MTQTSAPPKVDSAALRAVKGIGRESDKMTVALGILVESLNQRLGWGLTTQEIGAVAVVVFCLARRLRTYLEATTL